MTISPLFLPTARPQTISSVGKATTADICCGYARHNRHRGLQNKLGATRYRVTGMVRVLNYYNINYIGTRLQYNVRVYCKQDVSRSCVEYIFLIRFRSFRIISKLIRRSNKEKRHDKYTTF